MQLNDATTPARPDPIALQRTFNDLALDMTRTDAQLENAQRDGKRIGSGWDTWFSNTAQAVLDARDAYMALMVDDRPMFDRLGVDALQLATSAGNAGSGYRAGRVFGDGWSTTLDQKIIDVQDAAARLSRRFGA